MSANLFGERFLSLRQPAWHHLGKVVEEGVGAVAALECIGRYDVVTEQLFTASGLATEHCAIVRQPTAEDPQPRILGIATEQYTLITPADFCCLWDEHVARDVETIGALSIGQLPVQKP